MWKVFYFERERKIVGDFNYLHHLMGMWGYGTAQTFKPIIELINEIGELLALQGVGWDFGDPTYEILNTKTQGQQIDESGYSPTNYHGHRSENPELDRLRVQEIYKEFNERMDILLFSMMVKSKR